MNKLEYCKLTKAVILQVWIISNITMSCCDIQCLHSSPLSRCRVPKYDLDVQTVFPHSPLLRMKDLGPWLFDQMNQSKVGSSLCRHSASMKSALCVNIENHLQAFKTASLWAKCPENALTHWHVSVSQMQTLLSLPALANSFLAPLNASERISSVCPLISWFDEAFPLPFLLTFSDQILYFVVTFCQ